MVQRPETVLTAPEQAILCSHSIDRMLLLWKEAILESGTDVALDDFESAEPILRKLWHQAKDSTMQAAWAT